MTKALPRVGVLLFVALVACTLFMFRELGAMLKDAREECEALQAREKSLAEVGAIVHHTYGIIIMWFHTSYARSSCRVRHGVLLVRVLGGRRQCS